jgi:hypothetical protein
METIIDKTYTGETTPAIITGKVFRIKDNVFIGNSFLTIASFPNCSIIGDYAFCSCSSLASVSFPNCSIIGNYAFYACSSLASVSFPNCSIIGNYAFYACSSLISASFSNCNVIGVSAFNACSSLASVSFPNCSIIDRYAFSRCISLISVYLLGSILCTLSRNDAFDYTPIKNSSYLGYYGSIYVPTSLLNSYKTATNWATIADRIVGI